MKTLKTLEKQVNAFNAKYNTGDIVTVKLDNGNTMEVSIKSPASVLGGHSAVAWFNEMYGCYSLDKVV